jgi:hypothetical protein
LTQSATKTALVSKKALWTGRIVSALVTLVLLLDALMKVMKTSASMQGTVQIGYPENSVFPIGIILLISTVVYAVPRTSILGAILLTGYLGGAVASNVRIVTPLFSYTLVPVYVGVLVWGGLYLREERLRQLIPLRSSKTV